LHARHQAQQQNTPQAIDSLPHITSGTYHLFKPEQHLQKHQHSLPALTVKQAASHLVAKVQQCSCALAVAGKLLAEIQACCKGLVVLCGINSANSKSMLASVSTPFSGRRCGSAN
jgi:hypothetical protein